MKTYIISYEQVEYRQAIVYAKTKKEAREKFLKMEYDEDQQYSCSEPHKLDIKIESDLMESD